MAKKREHFAALSGNSYHKMQCRCMADHAQHHQLLSYGFEVKLMKNRTKNKRRWSVMIRKQCYLYSHLPPLPLATPLNATPFPKGSIRPLFIQTTEHTHNCIRDTHPHTQARNTQSTNSKKPLHLLSKNITGNTFYGSICIITYENHPCYNAFIRHYKRCYECSSYFTPLLQCWVKYKQT